MEDKISQIDGRMGGVIIKEIVKLLKACFPNRIIVENDNKEDNIIEIDGWIFLRQEESEFQFDTLTGVRIEKRLTFTVDKLVHCFGNRDTPPEDDYIVIGDRLSFKDACKTVGKLLAEDAVDQVFEREKMDKISEEL